MILLRRILRSPQFVRMLGTSCRSYLPAGYLSESYQCRDAWNKRLESPILKKIELDELFHEMDLRHKKDKIIAPIDVDLFVNKVTSEEFLEEAEELVHRLRKSPGTVDALPSTGHAIIRLLLDTNKLDILMRITNDRWNYGVFVDNYLSHILMDKFLSEENYRDAVKIASLHMLQEDFGGPTTKLFILLSCLKYVETPVPEPWDEIEAAEKAKAAAEAEAAASTKKKKKAEEATKVRVRFLRQPGFDDHFDLTDQWHVVGKTMAWLSFNLSETDEVLARSVSLLGWALYDKWVKVETILAAAVKHKTSYEAGVLKKVAELAEEKIKIIEESPDKSLPKPKLHRVPGINLDPESVEWLYKKLNIPDYASIIPKVKSLLESGNVSSVTDPITPKVDELLRKRVAEYESAEIADQEKLYAEWERNREQVLRDQIQRIKNEKRLMEIDQQKKELLEQEERIFFFDHEDEWMLKQPPAVRVYKYRYTRKPYKPPKSVRVAAAIARVEAERTAAALRSTKKKMAS